MDWFEPGIKDAVIEYVKSDTGNGSGRVGASPYAAIFTKEGFPVGQWDLRAVNGYYLEIHPHFLLFCGCFSKLKSIKIPIWSSVNTLPRFENSMFVVRIRLLFS